jgi:hypothetical protein
VAKNDYTKQEDSKQDDTKQAESQKETVLSPTITSGKQAIKLVPIQAGLVEKSK